jgi:hypothetical protein
MEVTVQCRRNAEEGEAFVQLLFSWGLGFGGSRRIVKGNL